MPHRNIVLQTADRVVRSLMWSAEFEAAFYANNTIGMLKEHQQWMSANTQNYTGAFAEWCCATQQPNITPDALVRFITSIRPPMANNAVNNGYATHPYGGQLGHGHAPNPHLNNGQNRNPYDANVQMHDKSATYSDAYGAMKKNYESTAVNFTADQVTDARNGNGTLSNAYHDYINGRPDTGAQRTQDQPQQNNNAVQEPTPIDEPSETIDNEEYVMLRVEPVKLDENFVKKFSETIGTIEASRYTKEAPGSSDAETITVYEIRTDEPCFDDERMIRRIVENTDIIVDEDVMVSVVYPEVCSAVPIKSASMTSAIAEMRKGLETGDMTSIRRGIETVNKVDTQASAALIGMFNKRITAYLNMFCSDATDATTDVYNDVELSAAIDIVTSSHPKEIQVMIDRHGKKYIPQFTSCVVEAIMSITGKSRPNILNHMDPRDLAYSSRANGMVFIDSDNTPAECYHVVQDPNYVGNYMDIVENHTVLLKNKRHILTRRIVNPIGLAGIVEDRKNLVKMNTKETSQSLELAAVAAILETPCETSMMMSIGTEETKSTIVRALGKNLRGEIIVK